MADRRNLSRGAGLGTAFFVVLVVCGLLLVLLGGGNGAAPEPQAADPREQRLWDAYTSADEAERALTSNDFGEAQRHVRQIKDALGPLIQQPENE